MSEVIAVANQKGGVGKTMTSVSMAAGLVQKQKKVLLVDFDPQGHSTKSFGFVDPREYPLSMTDVLKSVINDYSINVDELILHSDEDVDIVPSNISLAGISNGMESVMCRETILKRFVDTVKDRYDYVIIDTNPTQESLKAYDLLENKPTVIDIPTIKPIDKELIIETAKTHDVIVTVEEHNIYGGLGSAVSEVLAPEGISCRQYMLGMLALRI